MPQQCKNLYGLMMTSRGITLIEVMVIVAIVGILSGISFQQWGRYVRKSKTAEAKTNLLTVYAAQERYKYTCNTYYPDLKVIGAIPEGLVIYNVGSAELTAPTNADSDYATIKDYGCLTGDTVCNPSLPEYCHNLSPLTNTCCSLRLETICAKGETLFEQDDTYPCYWNDSRHFVDKDNFTNFINNTKTNLYSGATNTPVGVHHRDQNPMYVIHAVGDLKNSRNSGQYDSWAINHKGIIQHVQNGVD